MVKINHVQIIELKTTPAMSILYFNSTTHDQTSTQDNDLRMSYTKSSKKTDASATAGYLNTKTPNQDAPTKNIRPGTTLVRKQEGIVVSTFKKYKGEHPVRTNEVSSGHVVKIVSTSSRMRIEQNAVATVRAILVKAEANIEKDNMDKSNETNKGKGRQVKLSQSLPNIYCTGTMDTSRVLRDFLGPERRGSRLEQMIFCERLDPAYTLTSTKEFKDVIRDIADGMYKTHKVIESNR